MAGSIIVSGARTPIGKMSGALASLSAADLGGIAIAEALARAGVAPDEVDHVIVGQVLMAGQGQVPSRQAAVKAGIPMSVPSVNVNKVCLSGLNAIYLADQMIAVRRGRHRRRRRDGVDDERAVPRRRRTRRVPLRQRRARRRDHQGRAVVRVRRLPDGTRHRSLHRRLDHPRGAGRVRRPIARARRQRHQGRALRGRDRHRAGPAAQGRPDPRRARRRGAARNDGREPRRTAAGVRQERHGHGRQRVTAERRRERGRGDVACSGGRRVASPRSARSSATAWWPGPTTRRCCTSRAGAINRALERAGLALADVDLFEINEAFAAVGIASIARARHRRRRRQRQRRGDRPRPPDRDEREPPGVDAPARAEAPWRRARRGRAVWRGWAGRRPRLRAF